MVMTTSEFWVVDLEGSGSKPPEIVELAMLKLVKLNPVMQRHWLVRPSGSIDPFATRIHGITEEDLIGAPSIDDISDDILACLSGAPIVGHNVRVELEALSRSLPEWKPQSAIDTLKLSKLLLPGRQSYALTKLGADLGLDDEAAQRTGKSAHCALYDATLTALLFAKLIKPLTVERIEQTLNQCDILFRPQSSLF